MENKCYDKFNQILKEGDYVDVQRDGVHQIYKKEDGQLYFKPYGEEDKVNAYFSNDIAKCDADGNWINNDRYKDIEEETETIEEEVLSNIKLVLLSGNDSQAIRHLEQYKEHIHERMYTVEDLEVAFIEGRESSWSFNDWFEQFNKK